MAYSCPHCNQPVRRAPSDSGWGYGGLLAWILSSAMADFDCKRCGKILREEFPPEVQQQMASGSYTMVIIGAVMAMASSLVVAVIYAVQQL